MKYLKTNQQYNESLKSKLATGMLALGLASCDEPYENTQRQTIQQPTENVEIVKKDVDVSNNFVVDQDIISIGSDFHITSGDNKCGVVEERIMSWGKTFEYMMNDTLVSRAEERLISWGVNIDVYDNKKNKIGSIEEEILEGMFSIKTIYSIKNANGDVIGKSKKLDFFGTDIDVYDNSDKLIATMTRPMINLMSDTWTIDVKADVIDKRILIFIPCYKTSVDAERESEDKKKDE